MRKLVIAGVSPAEAALRAINFEGEFSTELIAPAITGDLALREELVNTLFRAAASYDRDFIEEILRSEISSRGVIHTWNDLLVPLLILIGDEWAELGTGIETEHLISEIIKRLLQEQISMITEPINSRPVLLACIGEEMHSLPLYALAAALSERKIATQFLGARTPIEAVSAVVKRSAPPAIFLWAQLKKNADLQALEELPTIRPAPRVVLGGPGWGSACGKSNVLVHDLREACEEISRAVGA
jgi:hypothetical protein